MNNDLTTKTKPELARIIERHHLTESPATLARDELQRRLIQEQHQLDIKLMTEQVRSMRFSAILGVLATLAGAIIGACLQYVLSK